MVTAHVDSATDRLVEEVRAEHETAYHPIGGETAVEIERFSLWYGNARALTDVMLSIPKNKVTAIIGPSGCGKSTLLRSINRMNDEIKTVRTEGTIRVGGSAIYGRGISPVEVRRRVGMVFQQPNPFPRSIRDNILYGAKINGYKGNHDALVREALERSALWDEVRDDLKKSGVDLSGGQQQRLCIARAIALAPEVLLMDEPCSALDPISTLKIEDLIRELASDYTIVLVTHNMSQAARVADYTAFMLTTTDFRGRLIEYGPTGVLFTRPRDKRTEDYITGRFG